MKAYLVKPFERIPGQTVRMGLPVITIAIGDQMAPVEYLKEAHPGLFEDPIALELWDETDTKLIWESHPHA